MFLNCTGSNTEYDIPQENIWSETANCNTTDDKTEVDYEEEEEDINNAARSERFVIYLILKQLIVFYIEV